MSERLAVIQSTESVRELKDIKNAIKDLIPVINDLKKNVTSLNRGFQSGKPKEYTASLKELKEVTKQLSSVDKELISSMERLANIERTNAQAAAENARARKENALAIKEESKAKEQLAREARNEEKVLKDNNSAHKRLTKEVKEARQKARDYGAEIIDLKQKYKQGIVSTKDYNNQQSELKKNFKQSTNEAIKLEKQLKKLNQDTLPSGQRNGALPGRVMDIVKGIGLFAIAQKAVSSLTSAAYKLGVEFFNTAVKLETMRFAQKAVFKTNEEVRNQNVFLTEIAHKYGLEILSLTDSYTKFSASAIGTTLEGAKSKEIFEAVTKSSAMLGVTTDDTNGILRALGQMMSKGKVQAEELRGQLGDRMAGAFKLFADGMGVSTAELDKMLKDGKVITEEVLPKFAAQLNKKYQLGLGEDIDTKQASIARLKNEWVDFVDSVESRTGIVSKGLSAVANSMTSLLQAMKPSKEVTAIEQEQLQLNVLGIQLRQNWQDQNKRKEIIEKLIAVNPLLLDGLNKEKATLEDISKRIQDVNGQYVQKIILQEQEEKIKELVNDQAIAYRDLSNVLIDNAKNYTSLNTVSKNAIDQYMQGAISQQQATEMIRKSTKQGTKEQSLALSILGKLMEVYEENRVTTNGYIRSIGNGNIAIRNASGEYNNLVNVTNKLFGVQGQLLNMNGLLATSFNKSGQAAINQRKQFEEIFKVAEAKGKTIALINNVWREKVNGKWTTTTKKETDGWYEENGKIVQRKPPVLDDKPKKYTGAKLDGYQKDFIMIAQGQRDMEIARLKQRKLDLKIDEEEYWKEYEKVIQGYSNKIQNYLKGKNAKEIQVEGATYKKAVEASEQSVKELYDIRSKRIEEQNKKEKNILDRKYNQIEQNNYLTDYDRLIKQIEIDNESLEEASSYYDKQINLAIKKGQDVIDWERKRDEEIGKIQDDRFKRQNSLPDAIIKQVEYDSEQLRLQGEITYEQKRRSILTSKRLNQEEKNYQLSLLDKQNEIDINENEINRLKALKGQLLIKRAINQFNGLPTLLSPEAEQQLKEYDATIEKLTNDNIQNKKDIKLIEFDKIAQGLKPIVDLVDNGLKDLGLNSVADQFTKMYQKILDEGKEFSLSNKEIFEAATSVISDFSQMFINKQKENTIAALDEQLKHSQDTAEQEIGFINQRLEYLNNLEELTEEQQSERRRLEDEARTYKEQQQQREKLIATQKAKAEQKAASQQALINGALAATMTLAQMGFIAGAIPAALALAFGIAQSVAINSRNPVPEYFVGREGGKAEWAWTQEKGREIITDKSGNIKSLGSNKGAEMTWLEQGDKVFTAEKSNKILERMYGLPKMGENVFRRIALKSIGNVQMPVVVNQNNINLDELADKMAQKMDKVFHKYSHTSITRANGFIYQQRGANNMEVIGTYDPKTLEENYKK